METAQPGSGTAYIGNVSLMSVKVLLLQCNMTVLSVIDRVPRDDFVLGLKRSQQMAKKRRPEHTSDMC